MNKHVLQLIIITLLIVVAGLIYYQYAQQSQTDDFKIETPAGTIKGTFDSNNN